jgi:hypothetical protein
MSEVDALGAATVVPSRWHNLTARRSIREGYRQIYSYSSLGVIRCRKFHGHWISRGFGIVVSSICPRQGYNDNMQLKGTALKAWVFVQKSSFLDAGSKARNIYSVWFSSSEERLPESENRFVVSIVTLFQRVRIAFISIPCNSQPPRRLISHHTSNFYQRTLFNFETS